MTPALLVLLCPALAGAGVEVVRDGPVPVERGQIHVADDRVEVDLGALLGVEIRAGQGAGLALPHARLRVEALVDTMVPVGMRLELEASPLADAGDNLNGPGMLRDAFLRLGVGNRKVLDLGEVSLGQQRVPSSIESLRPPEHWRFTRRPLVEERALPGRDLGFVYHVNYAVHGWPLAAWVSSFAGAGPNRIDPSAAPLVAMRVELNPVHPAVSGWLDLRTGLGVVSQASDPDLPLLVLADASARAHRFSVEAQVVVADAPGAELFERGALRAEIGVEVLPDFWTLALRHESWALDAGPLRHRMTVGSITTYLDDAFQVLADLSWPLGMGWGAEGPQLSLAFRIWW
ncbi:MAG: hypothetical protein ABIJ09_23335 [Pseudomonadota bacterium]